jgi:hypothetical protein
MKESEYMSTQLKSAERDLSKERLLEEYLTDTRTVYTVLRSVSASGMTRHISLLVAGIDNTGKPALFDITYHASKVLGDKLSERNGHRTIKVNGCGMDMGFNLVYSLSSVLFAGQDRAGYELSQRWI